MPKVVQMRHRPVAGNNYRVPEVLPRIQNVFVAINSRLVGNIEALILGNGGLIDATVADGQDRVFPFNPLDEDMIRNMERR